MVNFILAMMKLQASKWDELVLTEMRKSHCLTEKGCFKRCLPVHKRAEFWFSFYKQTIRLCLLGALEPQKCSVRRKTAGTGD